MVPSAVIAPGLKRCWLATKRQLCSSLASSSRRVTEKMRAKTWRGGWDRGATRGVGFAGSGWFDDGSRARRVARTHQDRDGDDRAAGHDGAEDAAEERGPLHIILAAVAAVVRGGAALLGRVGVLGVAPGAAVRSLGHDARGERGGGGANRGASRRVGAPRDVIRVSPTRWPPRRQTPRNVQPENAAVGRTFV